MKNYSSLEICKLITQGELLETPECVEKGRTNK